MTTLKYLLVSCLVVLTVSGVSTANAASNVTIGALFPLSGPNSEYGTIFTTGSDLGKQHINADHLINGKLSIDYEDSRALPQPAVIGMSKLVHVDNVPYVLSAFTGVTKAVSTLAARTKTVVINGGGVGPVLATLGPYVWNDIPLATYEVKAIVPYLVNQRHLKRFVLIYINDPFGNGVKKELGQDLPKGGAQLVESLSITPSARHFGGVAARVRAAKPDAVYIASYGAQQLEIVKQLRDNGVGEQLVSYSGIDLPKVRSLPEAKGLLFTTEHVDWKAKDPITQRFLKDYKAKYHKTPSIYAVNYYNAVLLFGDLAHQLQKQGKPVTGKNLLAQRMKDKDFHLVGGKITFTKKGTVVMPIQINKINGTGGSKVVGIVPVSTLLPAAQ